MAWPASVRETPDGIPPPEDKAATSDCVATRSALSAAVRSTGAEKGESGNGGCSSPPGAETNPSVPVVACSGTVRSIDCNASTRGAVIAVWLAAGARARDCANAKGEADPADAPPKERPGTEDGRPSVGMSSAPKGGWIGTPTAVTGAPGCAGADQGAGGDAGTAGVAAGAPPVSP